jgi:hypothetical protein
MSYSFGQGPTNKYTAISAGAGGTLSDYETNLNKLIKAYNAGQLSQEEFDARRKELQGAEFGPKSFDIGEFESLLGRLEGSKMRQQRQKSVEGRRDIMSQGLASMMSNF